MADHVYILCPFALESSLYTSWLEHLRQPYTIVDGVPYDWTPPSDAAIVVTHMHYRWEGLAALRKLSADHPRLPLLVLADGILEYRNTWLNPGLPAGCMFQPLLGHKVACVGKSQARVLESWGNVGKCELVGLPRLDSVIPVPLEVPTTGPKKPNAASSDPFRLLIATATTPAFNDEQHQTVLQSLRDLKKWVNNTSQVNGRKLETTWRLTAGLDKELGVGVVSEDDAQKLPPLTEVLQETDAVITTPSTMYLETVLQGLPTAVLDYHNLPAYVSPAWTISAEAHIAPVISELADPPQPKVLFQDTSLHDSLECDTPATPRMIELIETMVACGNRASTDDKPIQYPHRILTDSEKGFFPVLQSFNIEQLFPNAESFSNHEIRSLQIELEAIKQRTQELPREVRQLSETLDERNESLAKYHDLLAANKERREKMFAKIQELQARLKELRQRANSQRKPKPKSKGDK